MFDNSWSECFWSGANSLRLHTFLLASSGTSVTSWYGLHLVVTPLFFHSWRWLLIAGFDNNTLTSKVFLTRCYERLFLIQGTNTVIIHFNFVERSFRSLIVAEQASIVSSRYNHLHHIRARTQQFFPKYLQSYFHGLVSKGEDFLPVCFPAWKKVVKSFIHLWLFPPLLLRANEP